MFNGLKYHTLPKVGHSINIRANGPCKNKTGGRTDPGRTAFWANGFGGENFLGERTDILNKAT